MATSKTTTKAKTKTTKKPATKTAAKTTKKSAVKATKKPTAATRAKAPVKKAASKAPAKARTASTGKVSVVVGKISTLLGRFQVRVGLLLAALAVVAGYFMKSDAVQVYLAHLAKDDLLSRGGTTLASANHLLFEGEVRWLLVGTLAIAAGIALVRGTRYYAQEQVGVKARVQKLRWFDFAVTSALMFQIVALLNGVTDLVALKFGAVLVVIAALLGWLYEREVAVDGKGAQSLLVGAQVAVALPVIALLGTMYSTYVYGMERSPAYVYVASLIVVIGLVGTIRILSTATRKYTGSHDYYWVDRRHNILAVVVKVALAATLIIGLLAR